MQKRVIYLFFLLLLSIKMTAIIIVPTRYTTVNSHNGIIVQNVTVNQDKSITVTFKNVNSDNVYYSSGQIVTNSFEWYASYKGKRVSDYYTDALRCGKIIEHTINVWPGEVPNGYEKYISVQLGRELKDTQKDRRDDD